jgi:hypothetical protein
MESLAKLVAIIFFSVYGVTLAAEIVGLVLAIINYFPAFGGWMYCLWIPLIMAANWLLSLFILIIMSKIGSKS